MNGMSAANVGDTSLRQTEKSHLALLDQITYCARYILDRHRPIDTVLIKKIDMIGSKPSQGALHRLPDVLRPAISLDSGHLSALDTKPKFGSNHYLVSPVLQRPTEQFLFAKGP